jgi:hypothetical protein
MHAWSTIAWWVIGGWLVGWLSVVAMQTGPRDATTCCNEPIFFSTVDVQSLLTGHRAARAVQLRVLPESGRGPALRHQRLQGRVPPPWPSWGFVGESGASQVALCRPDAYAS